MEGTTCCRRSAGILLILSLAVGFVAQADVYSNVYFWSRGLATDADGDGVLDAAEGRDSLNRLSFSYTLNNSQTFTNQWAHLPYRGTTNFVQSIYLPQTVVVTNAETGAGYGYPCTFSIPNSQVNAVISQPNTNYTIFIRFRPDSIQPHPSYSWLFNFGHGTKRGLMVGFNGVQNDEHVYGGTHYYTNRTASLLLYYGGLGWTPDSTNARINLDNWNDLVISVEGRKMRILLSRDGYISGFNNNYDNSSAGFHHTVYKEATVQDGYDLHPGAGARFQIGSESASSGRQAYVAPASSNANRWKAFRGAVQTVAIWTNSMNLAQMREVAAWPRMDKWRLGVEDGKASEFASAADGAAVDVEGDTWALPALAANKSLTVRFPLDASGDAKMNALLRIKGAAGTADAHLTVAVNGTACERSKVVQAGRFTRWFVPADCLRANATNTLVITRVDAGTAPFAPDVVCFGGSVQYSEDNNSANENSGEGRAQYGKVYDLAGGNWFDGNRAVFGSVRTDPSKGTSYTNQVLRFSLPEDLRGLCLDYKLQFRVSGNNYPFSVFFNGTTLATNVYSSGTPGVSFDVPAALFRATNEVNLVNMAKYVQSGYAGIDYVRLNVQRPVSGLVLIVR